MRSVLTRVTTPVAALTLVAAAATPIAVPFSAGFVARAQAAGTPAGPAPTEDRGTIGIALAEAPTQSRQDPRAHLYIVSHLSAGETTTRRLEIRNDSDSAQRIEVYAGAATVHGGRFVPSDPGATSALTSWIQIDKPVLHLPPRGSAEVVAEISAPRDAASREHYGAI